MEMLFAHYPKKVLSLTTETFKIVGWSRLSSKTPQVIQGGAPLDSYMACPLYG